MIDGDCVRREAQIGSNLRGEGIGGGDQSEIRIGETKRDLDLMRSKRVFALRCVVCERVL